MTTDRVRLVIEKWIRDYDYPRRDDEITILATAIRSAIAEELEGERKIVPITYLPYTYCKAYNQAITDCQEHIKSGGGE